MAVWLDGTERCRDNSGVIIEEAGGNERERFHRRYRPMDPRCPLCGAVQGPDMPSGNRELQNTVLKQTNRFVVLPSVGPVLPGHVMVVSREHLPSLASMGREALAEYEALACELAARAPFSTAGVLEAEHGPTEDEKAGACVIHTHVHWIPSVAEHAQMFDGILEVLIEGEDIRDIASVNFPYIFVRGNLGKVRVYKGSGLPSQAIRRKLCEELGRDDIDWKQALRRNWIEQTVRYWEG